ncbi:MAG TPA: N-acetyltransferase [Candidatus Stackebrandtia faecavium]|nr:N-acetyltransferase [Candidatus Stackebrandtia faecavium]
MSLTITDVPDENRYEATNTDGERVGMVEYIRVPNLISFTHTEVSPAAEGQGVGSALARHVLDQARADGVKVQPLCPFIKGWIGRHREYVDVLD